MSDNIAHALANQAAEIERLKERVEKLEAFCFGGVEAFATGTETNSGSARWLTKPLHVSDRSEMVPLPYKAE